MNLAIVGAGNIGSTLGKKWAAAGHTVRFGVRNPDDAKFEPLHKIAAVGSVAEAVAFGEVILLALPGAAVANFASAHTAGLAGKIVIDATNNLRGPEMNALRILAEKAPRVRLARAFSNLGWENFETPVIDGVQVDLFYCGQPSSRQVVEVLVADIGLRPIYLGDLDAAGWVDSMTRIWFALVNTQGRGRRIAFKLLEERHS